MGFGFTDALALTNPVGWGPEAYNRIGDLTKRPSAKPATYDPSLTAGTVGFAPDLRQIFSKVGTPVSGNINANYDALKSRYGADARGYGGTPSLDPNSYAGQRFGKAQALDMGNLGSTLGSQLGSTGYNDVLSQRDYANEGALANEIGALNRPSLLDQVFQGIGAAGKPLAMYAGSRGRIPPTVSPQGGGVSGNPSLSLLNSGSSGYGRYS